MDEQQGGRTVNVRRLVMVISTVSGVAVICCRRGGAGRRPFGGVDGRVVGGVPVETVGARAPALSTRSSGSGVVKRVSTSVYSAASLPKHAMRRRRCVHGEVEVVADVDALHLAPHDVVGQRRHGDDAVDHAFERDRRTGDARGRTTSEALSPVPAPRTRRHRVSNSKAERCTASACAMVAMLTTNSFVSRMLTNVSLSVTPSDRGCREIDSTGGIRPTTVKKDTGAMLPTPVVELVLTQAIARGNTLPMSSL